MVNASSNSVRWQRGNESTYGGSVSAVTPTELRYISENVERQDDFAESPEIRSDRTSLPGTVIDSRAGGSFNVAWTAGTEYNNEVRKALQSTTSFGGAVAVTGTTLSFAVVDNSLNDSGAGLGSMLLGQMLRVTGSTSNDGKVFKIIKIISTSKVILGGDFVAAESAGASITATAWSYMNNGQTQASICYEREHRDLSGAFVSYPGGVINSLAISTRAQDFVQGTIDVRFKEEVRATATVFAGTPTAATTDPLLPATTGVYAIFEGGPCGQSLTVGASTDATPIVVTTTTEHNLQTGDIVIIYGHSTNTNANGVFSVSRSSATTIALRNRSTLANVAGNGSGAGSGGTLVKMPSPVCFTQFDFEIGNNVQEQPQISAACGKTVASGRFTARGSMSFYMSEQRLLQKIADQARTSLCIVFKDTNGLMQAWDFPDVEIRSQSGTGSSGSDQAIVPTLEWGGVYSTVESTQVRVSKI